jgi:hypothetical protein
MLRIAKLGDAIDKLQCDGRALIKGHVSEISRYLQRG